MSLIKLNQHDTHEGNFFVTGMFANKSIFIAARIIMPETGCVHINAAVVTVKDIFTGLEIPPVSVANVFS